MMFRTTVVAIHKKHSLSLYFPCAACYFRDIYPDLQNRVSKIDLYECKNLVCVKRSAVCRLCLLFEE
jgi:hypothetical protein